MKILVTGGAGYIGGTVAGLLSDKGHQAVVFDNLSHGRRDMLPAGVEFIQGELADRAALENIFISAKEQGHPFDGVLHFAALIEAGESMVRPEIFFRNNTASTLSLLEAILAHGPRRLWRAGIDADQRGCAPSAHQRLRGIEAAGRAHAWLAEPHSRTALRFAALLQCGWSPRGARRRYARRGS